MIEPYQSPRLIPLFVSEPERNKQLTLEAEHLPAVVVDSSCASSAVMLGAGYFTPLRGFMSRADMLSVADSMTTSSGLFWPVPVVNRVPQVSGVSVGHRIALRDGEVDGNPPLAIQTVTSIEEITPQEIEHVARNVFGTIDEDHPGVRTFVHQGKFVIGGPIEVLNYSYFEKEFADTFRTAEQIRTKIEQRGWKKAVAFQTRNPMHRAHEQLCKIAMERTEADGVVIHMLLGKLKPGDIPANIRVQAIEKMVELYFSENTALICGYGYDMLYAGPREAVLHAIFRQNMGASVMVVGRDHAGVGDYYGDFDAQEIFSTEVPSDVLEIEIFEADHTAWSKKLSQVVMMRDVTNHTKEDFVLLSGTRVREMLSAGQALPAEFSRPEVAKILMDFYRKH